MPFEFTTPTAVKLQHINLRDEKHGSESAPAIDLKLKRTAGNDMLDLLHPKLRASLYFRSEDTEQQPDLDAVDPVLPNKLFPQLEPLAWDLEMTGCTVIVDYGLGDEASNVELCDCKVNQFRIDPKEGGTVELTFRVQTSNIPTGALDKLSTKLGHETQITLTRPEVKAEPQQQAIDGTQEGFEADQQRRSRRGARQQEAGDAFAEAHGASA